MSRSRHTLSVNKYILYYILKQCVSTKKRENMILTYKNMRDFLKIATSINLFNPLINHFLLNINTLYIVLILVTFKFKNK